MATKFSHKVGALCAVLVMLACSSMKTIKLTGFMAIAILFNTCGYICLTQDPFFHHNLNLSFTGSAGNNLAESIEFDEEFIVPSELYTLRVIFDNPADDVNYPIQIRSNGRYLGFFTMSRKQGSNACRQGTQTRKITFQLTFPQLFGDDKEREIVTYWRRGRTTRPYPPFPAYRVVFEGREFEVRHKSEGNVSLANIMIDKD